MNPELVAKAVNDLTAFAGDIDQEAAAALLLWYRYRSELTGEDKARIISTFEQGEDE